MHYSADPRVLHVLAPARQGGLESVVSMLSKAQRPRSHVAIVVSPGDSEGHPFVDSLKKLGVPFTPIIVRDRHYVREYAQLRDTITRVRPDVVHTHGYRPDVVAGAAARFAGTPFVSTVHGFTGGDLRNRINETVQCVALRAADGVIAVSRPLVTRLLRAGIRQNRISVIPNGFAPVTQSMTRADAREALGISSDARVIGWVGRFSSEKGPDVMLDAFAAVAPDSDWLLSMIGAGRQEDALKLNARDLGISKRVRWHGAVANAAALLPAFDAFVLSSRTEGTPIALLEAMHAGIPIIATAVGGVPDVVSAENALVVESEKPEGIADALRKIAADPGAADRRARAAHDRVVEAFSTRAWAEAVDAVYRRVTS